jgi:hypothetical protein
MQIAIVGCGFVADYYVSTLCTGQKLAIGYLERVS